MQPQKNDINLRKVILTNKGKIDKNGKAGKGGKNYLRRKK